MKLHINFVANLYDIREILKKNPGPIWHKRPILKAHTIVTEVSKRRFVQRRNLDWRVTSMGTSTVRNVYIIEPDQISFVCLWTFISVYVILIR